MGPVPERNAASARQTAQTLDRGLRILHALAHEPAGLSANEIAEQLQVDRAVVYRLIRTLEEHRLASRRDGRFYLGTGITELAGAIRPQLHAAALPELTRLAVMASATAVLTIADVDDAIILAAVEPRNVPIHVACRPGVRHPLDRGAGGISILAARPPLIGERKDIAAARKKGYAITHGELQEGAWGISVAIPEGTDYQASLAILALSPIDATAILPALQASVRAVADGLNGGGRA
jgi:DNA-binding IclR family transcriptional regulator